MLTPTERHKLLRAGRMQNARNFFFKDPLGLLAEAVGIGLDVEQALHCAGPSLRAVRPVAVFTSEELERVQETAEAMVEAWSAFYAQDYEYWAERNLQTTGRAYTGD